MSCPALHDVITDVHVDESVERYILSIVRATRAHRDIALGASPRGSLALYKTAQAWAMLRGRDYVIPDDIKMLAPLTLSHRLILRPESHLRGRTAQSIIAEILELTPLKLDPASEPRGPDTIRGGSADIVAGVYRDVTNLIPILVGLFLLAALLRIDTYFSLVYLLAVAYLLGRAWSRQSVRQLRTERRLVSRAFPGEKIAVELRVRNDGWLPVPWVEMHDSLPVDMITPPYFRRVLSLLPHQERRFSYDLAAGKRGYYAIGPMMWRTGDLLGFSPQQVGEHSPETIIVYPRVVPLQKLGLPTRSPLASLPAPAPLFEDPTRIIGVRDYQTGDSPRRIHWTASAGAGRLLVKRYQPAIARDTLICLDMDQSSYAFQRLYAASELAVITAASLANHIVLRENLAVGLSVLAMDPLQDKVTRLSVAARRGRDSLMGILEILARAQTYLREPSQTVGPLPEEGLSPTVGLRR